MPHKFAIGDRVSFHHERIVSAAHGSYVVTMQLPERDGEFEYHKCAVREAGAVFGPRAVRLNSTIDSAPADHGGVVTRTLHALPYSLPGPLPRGDEPS